MIEAGKSLKEDLHNLMSLDRQYTRVVFDPDFLDGIFSFSLLAKIPTWLKTLGKHYILSFSEK